MKKCLLILILFGWFSESILIATQLPATIPLSDAEKSLFKKHQIEVPHKVLRAENFTGAPLNQAQSSLSAYQGKLVLLNFWATWCSPCLHELPSFEKLYQEIRSQNGVILAIGMGEKPENIRMYLTKHPSSLPIIADPDMAISKLYGVQNIPVTYVISPQGIVIGRAIGPRNWDHPDLINFFKTYAKKPVTSPDAVKVEGSPSLP